MKKKLSEISTIIMGQSPKSCFYNQTEEGIPFLQGCTTFGRLYPFYDTWTTNYSKTAEPNDVLFTVRAPVGDVNYCKKLTAIGRGIAAIRAKSIDPKYLYYLLETNKKLFSSSSAGTIYQSISKDKIGTVELDIHNLDEQRHIVDTIGSVDDLIENEQEKTKILTALGIFKYESIFRNSKVIPLGNSIKYIKGKKPVDGDSKNLRPYFSIEALENGQSIQMSSEGVSCCNGEVLMVMDGASSGKAYLSTNGYVGSTLAKLVSDSLPASVLYFGLSRFQDNIMANAKGSAIPHADKSYISELPFISQVSNDEINEFDTIISSLLISRKKISLLKAQKQVLLNRYFK